MRRCGKCREPGHNRETCPQLADARARDQARRAALDALDVPRSSLPRREPIDVVDLTDDAPVLDSLDAIQSVMPFRQVRAVLVDEARRAVQSRAKGEA